MEKSDISGDPMKWNVEDSEILINRPPWLRARRDTVRLPDGRINREFYVLEYPDWVNVIAITTEGLFVVERQYRHGIGQTCLEICAGVMEKGESPLQAAIRELEEETGYVGGEWEEWMVLSGNASVTNNLTHCFIARGVHDSGRRHLDSTEDIKVELVTARQLYEIMLADGVKQSLMAAPLWKYFALNPLSAR